jgi:hypothetical protein
MARMDAVSLAAGRFVLGLIIRTELSAAERGNTTLYKPLPDCRPLAVASLTSAALRDIIVSHRCRVEKSVGGDAAGPKCQDTVFRQGRCLRGTANKESAPRAELKALSGLSFVDTWEPVRERYP